MRAQRKLDNSPPEEAYRPDTCGIVHCDNVATSSLISHMASLLRQLRLDALFSEEPARSGRRFTLIVPSNAAWERAQLDFSKAYNTLMEGQYPNYVRPAEGACNVNVTFPFHRARACWSGTSRSATAR